ncbi:MAG: flagellin lysine-N-methylase [bacterium]
MFIADYMEKFECIGSDCQDSCCAGWQVTIDKRTFKHYQKTNIYSLKPLFKKYIIRNRRATENSSFAKIKLDANGACPLLSDKGLCQVQQHMGEQALSKTCRTYPRINNIVDTMQEISGSVSCPEIARLALLNPNGIGFKEAPVNTEGQLLFNSLSTFDAPDGSSTRHFWGLQLASIEILKNRSASLWKRLVVLGFFCRKIAEQEGSLTADFIEKTASDYMALLSDTAYNHSLENLPTTLDARYGMIQSVLSNLANSGNKRFQANHKQAMEFLLPETSERQGEEKNVDKAEYIEALESRYEQALEETYQPFFREHHYILENYVVNYVFKSLFPSKPDSHVFRSYMGLVVNFTVLRTYLIGLAGAQKEQFDTDSVLNMIQSFAKLVEHNEPRLQKIRKFFVENGYDAMSHMSILLKEPSESDTQKSIQKEPEAPFVKAP